MLQTELEAASAPGWLLTQETQSDISEGSGGAGWQTTFSFFCCFLFFLNDDEAAIGEVMSLTCESET